MASSGVGGFSYAPGEISLAWNEDFRGDKNKQMDYLKDTVFHEYYHQVQGYVGTGGDLSDLSPLQVAVYEGTATVFARDKSGACVADTFADYNEWSMDEITKIAQELSTISARDDWDWDKWKFNHPKYGRHVLYKLGTYLVDQYLDVHTELSIEGVARQPAELMLTDL